MKNRKNEWPMHQLGLIILMLLAGVQIITN